jgi:hypothetical protein
VSTASNFPLKNVVLHRMLMFSVTASQSSSHLLSIFCVHSFIFIIVVHYQEEAILYGGNIKTVKMK